MSPDPAVPPGFDLALPAELEDILADVSPNRIEINMCSLHYPNPETESGTAALEKK